MRLPVLAVAVVFLLVASPVVAQAGLGLDARGDSLATTGTVTAAQAAGTVAQTAPDGDADAANGTAQSGGSPDATDAANESTNATPPRHLDPAEADGQGDVSSIEAYLVAALGDRLRESADALSADDYQRAREILGPDYDRLYARYELIASDRELDTTGRSLVDAREEQVSYVDTVQTYDRTLRQYQEARAAGNEARARELARELDALAAEASTSRQRVEANYTAVETTGGVDLTDGRERLVLVGSTVETEQVTVRDTEFRRTEIAAGSRAFDGSFADPFPVFGRVTEADGTPLANASLNVTVGAQATRVLTDETGAFALDYRPTMAPLGRQDVEVAFVPDANSSYLGSTTTIDVRIAQSTPALVVDAAPARATYGETLTVAGRTFVDDSPAGGATVALSLDGQRRLEAVTDASGRYVFELSFPADVAPGDGVLRVGIPVEERALAPVNVTRPLTVESTATEVRLANVAPAGDGVRVTGTFRTVDGRPVPNATLDVRVDGTSAAVVRTDESGRFARTVPVAVTADRTDDPTVSVVVAFAGRGSNLRPDESDAVGVSLGAVSRPPPLVPPPVLPPVPLPGGGTVEVQDELLVGDVAVPTGAVAVVVVAGVVLGGLLALRRIGTADGDDASPVSAVVGRARLGGGRASPSAPSPRVSSPRDLLRLARERLAADPAAATERAYLAARRRLEAAVPGAHRRTHTEFYEDVRRVAGVESLEPFGSLTATFERAAFSPRAPSKREAAGAIETAESLLSWARPGGPDEDGDGSNGTKSGDSPPK